jgi:hypothetical protein
MQETAMSVDLRNMANEQAQQAELLLMNDGIESKLCISALKITHSLDWLLLHYDRLMQQARLSKRVDSETELSSPHRDTSLNLVELFFTVIHRLSQASSFAPAASVADAIVCKLGSKVAKVSEEQTRRIFDLIKQRDSVLLLSKIFEPCCAPTSLPEFYKDLSVSLDETELPVVFETFDLGRWLGSKPQPTHAAQKELFDIVLRACELQRSIEIFRRHLMQFLLMSPAAFWVDFIPKITESAVYGRSSLDMLRYVHIHYFCIRAKVLLDHEDKLTARR